MLKHYLLSLHLHIPWCLGSYTNDQGIYIVEIWFKKFWKYQPIPRHQSNDEANMTICSANDSIWNLLFPIVYELCPKGIYEWEVFKMAPNTFKNL